MMHGQLNGDTDLCTCATICVELLSRDDQREHIEAGGYPAVICILIKRKSVNRKSQSNEEMTRN